MSVFESLVIVQHELMLFAALGFLVGGIDELIVDLIWIGRTTWRRFAVFTRHERATVATLRAPLNPGVIAVFIGAWDEAPVIGRMLGNLLSEFGDARYHVFVGVYPNDQATAVEIGKLASDRISVVVNSRDGPTTKADNLNQIWRAMVAHEQAWAMRFKAIVLHDAEDVVHRAEPTLYDRMIEQFALVQLPVHPLPDPASRWISGHYCDEFAEAHAKAIVVREAIGAAVPAAGVGCALSRHIIERIAQERSGAPFDAHTLTEDYELGLRVRELGGRTALIRISEVRGGPCVAIRAHFPATISTAVRQKTRWIIGISLAGWDRLGWSGGWFENWMRLRDRRAPVAAVIISAAYLAVLLYLPLAGWAAMVQQPVPPMTGMMAALLMINGVLLLWRMGVRAAFVTSQYCWREGLRSIPRAVVSNIIAVMAARRAVAQYWQIKRGVDLTWDKTDHYFPDIGR